MNIEALIDLLVKELEWEEANARPQKGAAQRDLILRLSQYRVEYCERNN